MDTLAHRRRQLLAAFEKGTSARREIDFMLNTASANELEDLCSTMRLAELRRLKLLRRALFDNRVIARRYVLLSRRSAQLGCFMNILFGMRSNKDLVAWDYPTEAALDAACRSVRNFDYGLIDSAFIRRAVKIVIREREELSAREESAVQRVRRRLRLQPTRARRV